MKVSEIGMGCWAIGGNDFGNSYGNVNDVESIKAIKKALSLGCNFFDTADVYGHGHSEEILGAALSNQREKAFIATKVGGSYMYGDKWGPTNFSEDYIRFAIEQSMKRLKTNYIDIYQLHNPNIKLIKEGEVFKPLRKLQKEGKIKFVGVSVHTLDEGVAALEHVDSIQCVFNMIDVRNYELLETAKRRGIGIIVREPLANGFLTCINKDRVFDEGDIRYGMPLHYKEELSDIANNLFENIRNRNETRAQLALKFITNFDSVSVVIPGCKTEKQTIENMSVSELPDLTEEEMSSLGA